MLLEKGDLRLEYGPTGLCLAAGTPANDSLSRFRELLERETSPEGARALAGRTLERNTGNPCGRLALPNVHRPRGIRTQGAPWSAFRGHCAHAPAAGCGAAHRRRRTHGTGQPLVELALPTSQAARRSCRNAPGNARRSSRFWAA